MRSARRIGILVVLAALGSGVAAQDAGAYRRDMHYDVTFALALADSWSFNDALVIASADQAIDENPPTDADLKILKKGLVSQAEQNYDLHCFSKTNDEAAVARNDRNQDVKENMAGLKGLAKTAIGAARTSEAAGAADRFEKATRARIAIGVYLHCQEDSWSHGGFGGTDTGHAGHDVSGKSPDIPARRPIRTALTVQEKLAELSDFMQAWHGHPTDLAVEELNELLDLLTDPIMLSMEDEARQACEHVLIEHWLYDTLVRKNKLAAKLPGQSTTYVDRMPQLTGDCATWFQGTFGAQERTEMIVVLPKPVFPQLTKDGQPTGVQSGGSYDTVPDPHPWDIDVQDIVAKFSPTPGKDECKVRVRIRIRNKGPKAAKPFKIDIVVAAIDAEAEEINLAAPEGKTIKVKKLVKGEKAVEGVIIELDDACPKRAVVAAEVEQPAKADDRNPDNDIREEKAGKGKLNAPKPPAPLQIFKPVVIGGTTPTGTPNVTPTPTSTPTQTSNPADGATCSGASQGCTGNNAHCTSGATCSGEKSDCKSGATCSGAQSSCDDSGSRCTGTGSTCGLGATCEGPSNLCVSGATCSGTGSFCSGTGTACTASDDACTSGASCTGASSDCAGTNTLCSAGDNASTCTQGARCSKPNFVVYPFAPCPDPNTSVGLDVDIYIPNGVTALTPDAQRADTGGPLPTLCPGMSQAVTSQDLPAMADPDDATRHVFRTTVTVSNPNGGPAGGGAPAVANGRFRAYWKTD